MAIKCTGAYRRRLDVIPVQAKCHPREGGDLLLYSVPAPFQKNVKAVIVNKNFTKICELYHIREQMSRKTARNVPFFLHSLFECKDFLVFLLMCGDLVVTLSCGG